MLFDINQLFNSRGLFFTLWILIVALAIFMNLRRNINKTGAGANNNFTEENEFLENAAPFVYHTYYGSQLNFSADQLAIVLLRHFPYYTQLNEPDKARFIERLQKFIGKKVFNIHTEDGFIEMPILVSAAAIQLTFGLQKYLLPNFELIQVFPKEFMRIEPVICFLEGNVSGNCINLSWKHFLNGINESRDGKNVGLHEMSHALYYQNFICNQDVDPHFKTSFFYFDEIGAKVFERQKNVHNGIYSGYAFTNMQEFWAESIEIFFERGNELNELSPELYAHIGTILNQTSFLGG